MGLKEELNEIFDNVINHNEDIEKLSIFIRMRNGTTLKYKIDKHKEFSLLRNTEKKIQKIKDKETVKLRKIEEKKKKKSELSNKTKNQ